MIFLVTDEAIQNEKYLNAWIIYYYYYCII